jgi:ABC-type uncharacterized transport system fused permease/ATPase subunit
MVVGTLRDQLSVTESYFDRLILIQSITRLLRIIYPHTYTQFRAAGGTDGQLMEILEQVHLEYLPAREGGLTTVKEWRDVLSGGERQRVSPLARIQATSFTFSG